MVVIGFFMFFYQTVIFLNKQPIPHRPPAPSLRGKSDVDNIGVCVRAGGEAFLELIRY